MKSRRGNYTTRQCSNDESNGLDENLDQYCYTWKRDDMIFYQPITATLTFRANIAPDVYTRHGLNFEPSCIGHDVVLLGRSVGSLVVEGPVLGSEPGPSLACAIPSACSSGRRKARGRCALTLQRTDCIPRTRTASHCWALQREQNTPVHMWPFFQLNVKSPPVGGLLILPLALLRHMLRMGGSVGGGK